ncbi:MAG: hypothetical protein Q4F72_11095 [Desulfovibrionaceae bacterium]|nr:hypothetical protein [Desulfovibrionaceae bacterium]
MHSPEYERYHQMWSERFPEPRPVGFEGTVFRNAYCPDCRFCCAPQAEGDKPFPMALLDRQISGRTPEDFYMLDSHTACLDQRGCRALTDRGCRLENELRPVACNLFPYVLVGMRLYLYLICPASMLLAEERLRAVGSEVHAWLKTLPREDLERISISIAAEDLAARYADLGMEAL